MALINQVVPIVIQVTRLKSKIPTSNQFSAPLIVSTSAITENTLNVLFTLEILLVSCAFSMSLTQKTMHVSQKKCSRQQKSDRQKPVAKLQKSRIRYSFSWGGSFESTAESSTGTAVLIGGTSLVTSACLPLDLDFLPLAFLSFELPVSTQALLPRRRT